MSSDLPTYGMGSTQLSIGLSATVRVVPQAGQNGGFFKILSGGGTLAIVNGISSIASGGYIIASGEAISFSGPGVFYLAAAGATMTVGLCTNFSQGYLGT